MLTNLSIRTRLLAITVVAVAVLLFIAALGYVGLAEVNIGVTQLDQVNQHNAAMVEESTAASLALKQEAAGMATLVAQFALRAGQRRDVAAGLAEAPARQRRYAVG